jgi:hypothetical protein
MKTEVITNHKLPFRQSSETRTARKPKGISDDYLDFIKKVALTVIPYLDRNEVYRTEDLCKPIWDTTDPDEHKEIGSVISHLVATGQLPLRRIRNATDNAAQYLIVQSNITHFPTNISKR